MQWLKGLVTALAGLFKSGQSKTAESRHQIHDFNEEEAMKPQESRQQIHDFNEGADEGGNEGEGGADGPMPRGRQQIHGDDT